MKSSAAIIVGFLAFTHVTSAQAAGVCSSIFTSGTSELQAQWSKLSLEQKNAFRKQQMYSPAPSNVVQRRPIVKTSGLRKDASADIDAADIKIDTADPSLVMPITYPNGVMKYRINFSGLRYIEANTPMELFKGGIQKVQRSRGFYKDGTEMTGAYHNEAWAWDVVIYKNEAGELIALGGVMEQAVAGKLPNVAHDNRSRSRWWGKVIHKEVKPSTLR